MIKIIDFGFAAFTMDSHGRTQRLKIFCGTPSYMAPELVRKHEYGGEQVDMWALGVLLYSMLTGTFPFRGQSESELYGRIQRGLYKIPNELMSRDARNIIQKLLETDYRKRAKAKDLIRDHEWVQCKDLPLSIFENAGNIFRTSHF